MSLRVFGSDGIPVRNINVTTGPYSLELPPGRYSIAWMDASGTVAFDTSPTFTVETGKTTTVDLSFAFTAP
jgi:hypothetical protein